MLKQAKSLKMTSGQWLQIEASFPDSGSSSAVGKRAEEIARLYLISIYPDSNFVTPDKGADLAILYQNTKMNFEVKGTKSKDIAWPQLKVSSLHSYNLLVSGVPMLRITDVFSKTPIIYTLMYPNDFKLREEPRWAVHPAD